MTRKRKNPLFGKGRPRLRGTPFVAPVSAPVSRRGRALPAKALAKADKESESERLERKLSDSQLEAKLRRHYSGGGNLREFLAANPGVSKAQFERCAAVRGNPRSEKSAAYEAGRKALASAASRLGTVNLTPSTAQREDWRHAWKEFMAGWNAEKRRPNPADAAADVYEEFHGRPSSEVVTVTEKIHYHKNLAALGELRTLIVQARDGARVTLTLSLIHI